MTQPNTHINIAEKLMVVRLNCSFSFGHITDKQITAETNASKHTKALKVRKELLPGDSGKRLRELQATLSTFYTYHKKVTLDSTNEGERLLPVVFYLDYMAEYGAAEAKVNDAFTAFETGYPNDKAMAQQLLNSAWKADDYPPQHELRRHLNFRIRTLPLPQAETLLNVIGESVQTDVDSYLNEAVNQALTDVNLRIKAALQRMVTQLSDPGKKVYDSLTENLAELVSFIPSFNVVEDSSLNMLAQEIKEKLLRTGPHDLRTDDTKRKATADAAAEILRKMGA